MSTRIVLNDDQYVYRQVFEHQLIMVKKRSSLGELVFIPNYNTSDVIEINIKNGGEKVLSVYLTSEIVVETVDAILFDEIEVDAKHLEKFNFYFNGYKITKINE